MLALLGARCALAEDIVVDPKQPLQVIWGLGFEIQADSIGSGNQGLPDAPEAVPHDLVPSERQRLYKDMLRGFRYCRLAGGLYWRGLDRSEMQLRPRWPEQLDELREMVRSAGIDGLAFEYWSPAPYWKANRRYIGATRNDPQNVLRCFGPDFGRDPVYHGDVARFLADFSSAVVADLRTLRSAGLPVAMFGLQNEPWANNPHYSSCGYPNSAAYLRAYAAVAKAIRAYDAHILLFGDTGPGFPTFIAPAMRDPETATLVDAYVVHTVGAPSESVRQVNHRIRTELPARPWFQNEYEYLSGGASPARCLNTVQHIMDSFQLAGNPTWFWLHALKPFQNAEASGYSLGFWKSRQDPGAGTVDDTPRRWRDGPALDNLPARLADLEMISATRGDPKRPGVAYDFSVNEPVTVYLLVQACGNYEPGPSWQRTDLDASYAGGRDRVYCRSFPAGKIAVPEHAGNESGRFGAPHVVFLDAPDPSQLQVQIGVNVPIQVRSQYLQLQRAAARLEPGHWTYNPYNWNAVGSFVRHLPWNSMAVAVAEPAYDANARVFAFKRPSGKLTIVLSNRGGAAHRFELTVLGMGAARWQGFRYTPDDAGEHTGGVPLGAARGEHLAPLLPGLSWEFWEQQ